MDFNYNFVYEKIDFLDKFLTPKQILNLKTLRIFSLFDLLYYFPRIYEDRSSFKKISELNFDEYTNVEATLLSVVQLSSRFGKKLVKATVSDGTGSMEIIWFGMPYLKNTLKVGSKYIFFGQIKKGILYQIVNPDFKISSSSTVMNNKILPIYSLNKNFKQFLFRNLIKKILSNLIDVFEENIPEEIIKKYNIMPRKLALKEIHFPTSSKNIEEAKRRFAIEELLILEMGILKNKFNLINNPEKSYSLENKKDIVKNFISSLPFTLTNAQKNVISEIYKEISQGKIVNRLIQGDVGSGKTIIAVIMLVYMYENSFQGALMAPTEILAFQHYNNIKKYFSNLNINIELFTSSVKGKKRKEILENIKNGNTNIIIGTHSLIEENVEFNKLGLIIIDEQHKFGVNQRNKLREKGFIGNLLVMSATPIPRSLALTIYGDLDLSVVDELPPGRTSIKTKWIANDSDLKKMYEFIEKKIGEGNQAYFVAPLIEESEKILLKSVDNLYKEISKHFKNLRIGIIHGKMKQKEKDEIMLNFKEKKFDILVATTVIEVGIDIPNSTIITIFNAERFGLSALHQLRGRVGRGHKQSYCFLISKTKNENSIKRLSVMEKTTDGFKIAEEDLKLRNAGEIFGFKQSGLSDLKFIDIISDIKTIKMAHDECLNYLKINNGIIKNKYLEFDINKKFENFNKIK